MGLTPYSEYRVGAEVSFIFMFPIIPATGKRVPSLSPQIEMADGTLSGAD